MTNLLTVSQVAEAIDRSRKSVYRYIDEGKIRAERNGYGLLVPRSEVVRWLRAEQRKSRSEWQERIDRVRAA